MQLVENVYKDATLLEKNLYIFLLQRADLWHIYIYCMDLKTLLELYVPYRWIMLKKSSISHAIFWLDSLTAAELWDRKLVPDRLLVCGLRSLDYKDAQESEV